MTTPTMTVDATRSVGLRGGSAEQRTHLSSGRKFGIRAVRCEWYAQDHAEQWCVWWSPCGCESAEYVQRVHNRGPR